jgi:hypothetical protein
VTRRALALTPKQTDALLEVLAAHLGESSHARAAAAAIGPTPIEKRLLRPLLHQLYQFRTADAIRAAAALSSRTR